MKSIKPLLVVFVLASLATQAVAAEKVKPVTYSPHAAKRDCLMNMGPTGARAWMRGYHFVVVEIDMFSPAADVLEPADVVIAADGNGFGPDTDSRMALGNAIGKAEAAGKPLKLTVLRDGKKRKVEIDLPAKGEWGKNWPAHCKKSREILDDACQVILNNQMPNGQLITDGNMGTTLGGLLLLANPDPRFLDGARRAAYQVAAGECSYGSVCNNWSMGYGGMLLAEYYLLTGDDTVLPKLKEMVDIMCRGHMRSGGWGHTSPGGAYGTLNQVGIICAITLTLADECGVEVPKENLKKATEFFARFAEIGAVPYGDHLPYTGGWDSNGRSASSGVLMRLAGRDSEVAAYSRSVALSYFEREEGHTGGFFSITWGPLAAIMAGQDEFRTFMDYQKWYYDLSRTWKGGLVLLPYQEALTRFDSSSYISFGEEFTSGGIGLAFALPYRRLRILGAEPSVFGKHIKLTPKMQKLRKHWIAKEWGKSDEILDGMRGIVDELRADEESAQVAPFIIARDYRRMATAKLLNEIESNLDNQSAYRASHQYEALKKSLGEELDGRFEAMDKRIEGAARAMDSGKKVYDAWGELKGLSWQGWVPYGPRAEQLIRGVPTHLVPVWEPLSPISGVTTQSWRTLHIAKDGEAPKGWTHTDFDDSAWKEYPGIITVVGVMLEDMDEETVAEAQKKLEGARPFARRAFEVSDPRGDSLRLRLRTVRPANTKVYLNGVLVLDAVRGQRGGYATIPLPESALALLREGKNVLAVSSTKMALGGNHLDVGLEICRNSFETRSGAIISDSALIIDPGKDVDNTLYVRKTKDEFKARMQDECNAKKTPELVKMLGLSVAAQRAMAQRALVEKGVDGIEAAAEALNDKDWKVRSSACNVIGGAASKYREQADSEELKEVAEQVNTITSLLNDQHHWVQVRAAAALRSIGEPAKDALPALLKLVGSGNEWVRTEALVTLEKLAPDAETKIEAAKAALKIPDTAYRATRTAHRMLKDNPGENDGRLEALAVTLGKLPQGMGGGRLIGPMLDMGASLDPDGEVMIPVLLKAAADTEMYSRQQGGARNKAIDKIVSYGDKAKERAVPVLKAILESDSRFDQAHHGKVREALEKFGVEVPEKEEE